MRYADYIVLQPYVSIFGLQSLAGIGSNHVCMKLLYLCRANCKSLICTHMHSNPPSMDLHGLWNFKLPLRANANGNGLHTFMCIIYNIVISHTCIYIIIYIYYIYNYIFIYLHMYSHNSSHSFPSTNGLVWHHGVVLLLAAPSARPQDLGNSPSWMTLWNHQLGWRSLKSV